MDYLIHNKNNKNKSILACNGQLSWFFSKKNGVDLIINIHKKEEGLKLLKEKTGLYLNVPYINVNKNKRPYKSYYNKSIYNKVRKLYRKEINLYNFKL